MAPGGNNDVADQNELGGNVNNAPQRVSEAYKKTQARKNALGFYTNVQSSSLAGFDFTGLGYTPGSLDESGNVLGSSNLIYENGNLMVKTDMINSFYSIFKGQQDTAKARAASFLAQDTLLGEASSKKGTVLGGVI